MSILYRGPSIDASYQGSVHLDKRFQRRIFFRNRPIRKKNCCGGHLCKWIETKLGSIFGRSFNPDALTQAIPISAWSISKKNLL
jgi:hypothetical protein